MSTSDHTESPERLLKKKKKVSVCVRGVLFARKAEIFVSPDTRLAAAVLRQF